MLTWFGVTHELAQTGLGAYWRLAWLPGPGSIGDQDARLLAGLTVARRVMQAALAEEWKRERGKAGLDAWRARVKRGRR